MLLTLTMGEPPLRRNDGPRKAGGIGVTDINV
jgi:hypothetical protein